MILQRQAVRRRTFDVPMVFGVYVHVHDVTVSLTAQTLPTNSTAVSTSLTSCIWLHCRLLL